MNTATDNTFLGYNAVEGSGNVCIGKRAGASLTTGSNNILLGEDAGADLTTECGAIIIGDGIRNMDSEQNKGALFVGGHGAPLVAIGKTLFGSRIPIVGEHT